MIRTAVRARAVRTDRRLGRHAGRGITRSVTQLTDADLDDMMTTNVKSVLYGIQAALPHFRERKRGHLITVSSMLGRISLSPVRSAYSAAKFAVNSLMTSLRLELAPEFPEIHVLRFGQQANPERCELRPSTCPTHPASNS